MVVTVTFKTPDAASVSIQDAIESTVSPNLSSDDYDDIERDLKDKLSKWIRSGEYVTIDFDTDAGTATVRPVS